MTGKREIVTEKKPKLWLIPTVLAAAVVGVYAGFCVGAATGNTIDPNTVIAGTDVGGLTRTEAAQALAPALEKLRAESGVHITVDNGEEIAYLTYDELGAAFDAAALAEDAYERSHSGNPFVDGWGLLTASLGRTRCVQPEPVDGWQENAAALLADATGLSATDFAYEVSDDALTMVKARDGRNVDRLTLKTRLNGAEADEAGMRRVDLPYTIIAADQGDLQELSETLGGEMINASYDAETDTILPGRGAVNFNVTQAQMLLDAAAPGAQVTVPATSEQPEVSEEELKEVLFRDVLGTYTTTVSGAAGRKANVKLTAERVNGTVLNSGDEFDYYALCGPFTGANGYQPAPGYLNGKTVDMDGGGACQCSSTTYAAALLANLEIVARTAHGFASSYIGLGLDATVSGGGPEFIFRNNTAYPIKVEAIYSSNNRLTVNILGTKTDDTTVKMRVVTLSSTPYEDEVVETTELAPGERKVEQTPYTGYVVDSYREVYDGSGSLISSTYEARSNYRPRNRVTLVGVSTEPPDTPIEAPTDTPADTPTTEPPAETAPSADGEITPIEDLIDQLAPPAETSEGEVTGV